MADKSLADLIIEQGPDEPSHTVPGWMRPSIRTTEACNALRDELIELREAKARLDRLLGVPQHTAGCVAGVTCEPYCEAGRG